MTSSSSKSSSSVSCWTNFRKNHIKSAKSLFSSAGDIASDWVYYMKIQQNGPDTYLNYLFIICCISSVMGLLLVISLISNARQNREKMIKVAQRRRFKRLMKFDSFSSWVKSILTLEIFLEDIPQLVLTTLTTHETNGGELTTYAVFNITFSALNLIFNLFDMIELDDDDNDDDNFDDNNDNKNENAKQLVSDVYRKL